MATATVNRLLAAGGFTLGAAAVVVVASIAHAIWMRNRIDRLGDVTSRDWGRS